MSGHYTGDGGWDYFEHFGDQLLSDEVNAEKAAKINQHLKPAEKLVDFGCSAGRITRLLNAEKKFGVEISPTAGQAARDAGIEVVTDIAALPDGAFDAVVSHHALEHVESPFAMLQQFHRLLKPGGQLIIVVPGEVGWYKRNRSWRDEVNRHLFTWTPLTLGNLVSAASFKVSFAKLLRYHHESRFLGPLKSLTVAKRAIGVLRQFLQGETEVLLVATKEAAPRTRKQNDPDRKPKPKSRV
jgi:SAM-dependent methyltransferase